MTADMQIECLLNTKKLLMVTLMPSLTMVDVYLPMQGLDIARMIKDDQLAMECVARAYYVMSPLLLVPGKMAFLAQPITVCNMLWHYIVTFTDQHQRNATKH